MFIKVLFILEISNKVNYYYDHLNIKLSGYIFKWLGFLFLRKFIFNSWLIETDLKFCEHMLFSVINKM